MAGAFGLAMESHRSSEMTYAKLADGDEREKGQRLEAERTETGDRRMTMTERKSLSNYTVEQDKNGCQD